MILRSMKQKIGPVQDELSVKESNTKVPISCSGGLSSYQAGCVPTIGQSLPWPTNLKRLWAVRLRRRIRTQFLSRNHVSLAFHVSTRPKIARISSGWSRMRSIGLANTRECYVATLFAVELVLEGALCYRTGP